MRRQAGDSDESALLATDERAAGSDCYQAARMPWHAPLVPLPSLTSVAGAPDRDRPLCRSLRLLSLRDTHGESNETDKKIRRASERRSEWAKAAKTQLPAQGEQTHTPLHRLNHGPRPPRRKNTP